MHRLRPWTNIQLFVSSLLRCDRRVRSRVPCIGPAGPWPAVHFLTASAGQASKCPSTLRRSRLTPESRLKVPKIPRMHPSSMFFQAWSHSGEKPTLSLPSLHCSVSRGQPETGTNKTSRCQDTFVRFVIKELFGLLYEIPMKNVNQKSTTQKCNHGLKRQFLQRRFK